MFFNGQTDSRNKKMTIHKQELIAMKLQWLMNHENCSIIYHRNKNMYHETSMTQCRACIQAEEGFSFSQLLQFIIDSDSGEIKGRQKVYYTSLVPPDIHILIQIKNGSIGLDFGT